MKLESLRLKNFRGFKEEAVIPISNITALIGKNDAGKSSILEALEIFFNNSLVTCERDDLNKFTDQIDMEISCTFSELPEELIIDATVNTSLEDEYLLNSEGNLEIKKAFSATAAKPREKIYIICNHPNAENANDLLSLKRTELRARATELHIDADNYNANVSSSIRRAIWGSFENLEVNQTELLIDKEGTKEIYDSLSKHLPIFALFQSDRKSIDDDKEVADPMKIAVQQALKEVEDDLESIKNKVKDEAIETANRTLEKLQEMFPDLSSQLVPEFKSEPKFDSLFKLTIKSEDDIPLNKRGSGVRRLILLNFFRAEAERNKTDTGRNKIIYAFEEPETSQHPDHQEMLIRAFLDLANSGNTQVLLTTHTPALASLLPLDSLRYIENDDNTRSVYYGSEEVFEQVVNALGILPEPFSKATQALLLVEGKGDVVFIKHIAEKLKENDVISNTFEDKRFAIVPVGGCGNLKHWKTMKIAEQFSVPYCVLMDSDKGTNNEVVIGEAVADLRKKNIKAYTTRKREIENYIHPECIGKVNGRLLSYTDVDDAKKMISKAQKVRDVNVIEIFWPKMTFEQIREVETYIEDGVEKYEFTDMIKDFLSIVEE